MNSNQGDHKNFNRIKKPLDGGVQHIKHTKIFMNILKKVEVVNLIDQNIFNEYKKALIRKDSKSTLLIENGDFYNSK